jgi:hypothetical protein
MVGGVWSLAFRACSQIDQDSCRLPYPGKVGAACWCDTLAGRVPGHISEKNAVIFDPKSVQVFLQWNSKLPAAPPNAQQSIEALASLGAFGVWRFELVLR